MLYGGAGQDRFVYRALGEAGDTIGDFDAAGGDMLDLTGLLVDLGYLGSDPFADGYVRYTQSGANTVVEIDPDGTAGGASGYSTLVVVENVLVGDLSPTNVAF